MTDAPMSRAWNRRVATTTPTPEEIARWRYFIRDVMRAAGGISGSLDALAIECATMARAIEDAAFLRGVNARKRRAAKQIRKGTGT